MKKCDYCAKEISYHEQYCSDDCQRKANQYYEKYEKFARLFTVVNTVCVFGIPIGLFFMSFLRVLGTCISAGSCVVLGVMLILFPFPTEGMIRKYKLEKSLKITRFVGVGVIVLGVLVAGVGMILK